jgi:hypothetical protein
LAALAAERLEQRVAKQPTPEALSLNGAFHLVLAITAAREDDRQQAVTHLAHAHQIAASLAEDRNDYGTEFGPTNVALHAVSVAVELGDARQAPDLSRDIDPERLSADRRPATSATLRKHTRCGGRPAKHCTALQKPNG